MAKPNANVPAEPQVVRSPVFRDHISVEDLHAFLKKVPWENARVAVSPHVEIGDETGTVAYCLEATPPPKHEPPTVTYSFPVTPGLKKALKTYAHDHQLASRDAAVERLLRHLLTDATVQAFVSGKERGTDPLGAGQKGVEITVVVPVDLYMSMGTLSRDKDVTLCGAFRRSLGLALALHDPVPVKRMRVKKDTRVPRSKD